MTIQIGETIPDITLKTLTDSGMQDVSTAEIFANKKILLFAVPGAFTPTCTAKHLPGYIEHAAAFQDKGIDTIICMAVNDPFVMKEWGEQVGAGDKITLLPDGNATFAEALGLTFDASKFGLGQRCHRFAMLVENGEVKDLQIEKSGAFEVSSAEYMLGRV